MQAVQSPASGFAIAKEFMTKEFAAQWDPNAQVTIRRGASQITAVEGGDLDYAFTSEAWVDARGRYTETLPSEQRLAYSFQQVDGEWRISAAPPGIVLTVNSFDAVFRSSAPLLASTPPTTTWCRTSGGCRCGAPSSSGRFGCCWRVPRSGSRSRS